ncbi:unnamed protein product [Brassica napus]|uniref:(rape) hypothetical protein n=1 Tax=Brassica napus TaxID=3708 RepID=A0A816QMN7_BRANA|nr:unnamed protein product [Brassica napus]
MYRRYDPMFIMGVCQIHSYLVYTAAHQTWLQLGGCLAALFILMNWYQLMGSLFSSPRTAHR